MRRQREILDLVIGMALVPVALLTACAQTQPLGRNQAGEIAGNQGGAWEVVVGTAASPAYDDWEYARLDESMAIRGSAVDENAPALDDLRRLYLNPRPDQILYFRRPRY